MTCQRTRSQKGRSVGSSSSLVVRAHGCPVSRSPSRRERLSRCYVIVLSQSTRGLAYSKPHPVVATARNSEGLGVRQPSSALDLFSGSDADWSEGKRHLSFPRHTPGLLYFLTLLALFFTFAQTVRAQPLIAKIIVTNIGPSTVSESLIRANIHVKEGQPYNKNAIDQDIQKLYATGFFEEIRVREQTGPEGITVIYYLEGKLKLTDIIFVGNKKFRSAKLQKKLSSKIGEPYDARKVFADTEEIKKMYQKSGYTQTKVEAKPSADERPGRETHNFEITESPKVRVVDVYFEGAHAFSQRKLRRVIKTHRHWMFSWITGAVVLNRDKLAHYAGKYR